MKQTLIVAVATAVFMVPAMAKTPVLSGTYVYTEIESCVQSATSTAQTTGTLTFDPATGMATLSGYKAGGNPLTLTPVSGSAAYSNTDTTLTIDGFTYQVSYGKLAKGNATYFSYIGVVAGDSGPCGDQATLSLQ